MLTRLRLFFLRKWQWVAATIVGLFLLFKLRQSKDVDARSDEQKVKDDTSTRFQEGADELQKEAEARLQKECERNDYSVKQTEALKQRLRERYRKHEEIDRKTKEMGFKNL